MTEARGGPTTSGFLRQDRGKDGRVLVTGASGFVGVHLVNALLAHGVTVRSGVRSLFSHDKCTGHEQVPFDLTLPETFEKALAGVDTVVHLAALTHARNAAEYHQVNAEGTQQLLLAAREAGIKRFVLASSLAARGPSPGPAGKENPESDYGRSKLMAERHVEAMQDSFETVTLRLAGVYGPGDKAMFPLFRMASQGYFIVPSRTQLLQPLYIGDAASALLAATRPGQSTGVFEVAEPAAYGWHDVLTFFSSAVKRRIFPIRVPSGVFTLAGHGAQLAARCQRIRPSFDARKARDFAVHTWLTDATAAERTLQWTADTPLVAGLARTAAWYRQEGWLPA